MQKHQLNWFRQSFARLPRWLLRQLLIYIFGRSEADDAPVPASDELDEFGRMLFADPGYGTC